MISQDFSISLKASRNSWRYNYRCMSEVAFYVTLIRDFIRHDLSSMRFHKIFSSFGFSSLFFLLQSDGYIEIHWPGEKPSFACSAAEVPRSGLVTGAAIGGDRWGCGCGAPPPVVGSRVVVLLNELSVRQVGSLSPSHILPGITRKCEKI